VINGVSDRDQHAANDARTGGDEAMFHLHGFEHDEGIAEGDDLSGGD
jgi:hypothetical protein